MNCSRMPVCRRGDLEKARDYYLKLTQMEPQNQLHTRNYEQVLAKLGGAASGSRLITPEEGAVLVEELEATAPFVDQRYPDDVALAVRAALTDAELFVSYNMPAKALGPLMSALPKAPQDLRINQRLAALHTRAGRFGEAAVCCRNLEQLYHDAGHPDEASRYRDLASKYEERTSAKPVIASHALDVPAMPFAPASIAPPAFGHSPAEAADAPASLPESSTSGLFFHKAAASTVPEAGEFEIHAAAPSAESEIDISAEWDGQVSDEPKAASFAGEAAVPEAEAEPAPAETIAETVEELRFYLAHSMADQARVVFAKLEKLKPGAAQLAAVLQEIEAAEAQVGVKAVPSSRRSFLRRNGRGSVRAGSRAAVCRKNQTCGREGIRFRAEPGAGGEIQAAGPAGGACARAHGGRVRRGHPGGSSRRCIGRVCLRPGSIPG